MEIKHELSCAVVNDLLPLYHDGVVSEEIKIEIETHMRTCEKCSEAYKTLCTELPLVTRMPS